MMLFVDAASLKESYELGLISGVITNTKWMKIHI